jgi:hypothetical protein
LLLSWRGFVVPCHRMPPRDNEPWVTSSRFPPVPDQQLFVHVTGGSELADAAEQQQPSL